MQGPILNLARDLSPANGTGQAHASPRRAAAGAASHIVPASDDREQRPGVTSTHNWCPCTDRAGDDLDGGDPYFCIVAHPAVSLRLPLSARIGSHAAMSASGVYVQVPRGRE